jgi:hypothetical protein
MFGHPIFNVDGVAPKADGSLAAKRPCVAAGHKPSNNHAPQRFSERQAAKRSEA